MKVYNLQILPSARKEILEAKRFYEARRKGFGRIFSLTFNNEIERIAINPLIFKKNKDGFFEIPMKRFPHLIIYAVLDNSIIIVTLFHTSRNPKTKP